MLCSHSFSSFVVFDLRLFLSEHLLILFFLVLKLTLQSTLENFLQSLHSTAIKICVDKKYSDYCQKHVSFLNRRYFIYFMNKIFIKSIIFTILLSLTKKLDCACTKNAGLLTGQTFIPVFSFYYILIRFTFGYFSIHLYVFIIIRTTFLCSNQTSCLFIKRIFRY